MVSTEIKNIEKVWPKVSHFFHVPRNEEEYLILSNILDELIDEVGNSESHNLASLMETIGILISAYEDKEYQIGFPSGGDVLKYLLDEHNLKQSDLPEVGSQGVVSELLNNKRELNVRQIKLLSDRFHVSPAVFF